VSSNEFKKELRIEISEFPEYGLCGCEVEQDENKEEHEGVYVYNLLFCDLNWL
jgi:hypothetical protein